MSMSWIDETITKLGFTLIRDDRVQTTVAEFAALERQLGGSLPGEYRYFIERYGGGMLGGSDRTVEAPMLEPCPWGDTALPEEFYLVGEGEDSVQEQIGTYASRLPRGVMPIADDAGGNQVCLDVAGENPGSVWFWDHEQRWFKRNLQSAAEELKSTGTNPGRMSAHDIIRGWARLHSDEFDRPADYVGMYRMAPTFADFLRSLRAVPSE